MAIVCLCDCLGSVCHKYCLYAGADGGRSGGDYDCTAQKGYQDRCVDDGLLSAVFGAWWMLSAVKLKMGEICQCGKKWAE